MREGADFCRGVAAFFAEAVGGEGGGADVGGGEGFGLGYAEGGVVVVEEIVALLGEPAFVAELEG